MPITEKIFRNLISDFKIRKTISKKNKSITLVIECPTSGRRKEYQKELEAKLISKASKQFVNNGKGDFGRIKDDVSKSSMATTIVVYPDNKNNNTTTYNLVFKDPTGSKTISKTGNIDIEVTPYKMGVTNKWITPKVMAKMMKTYFKTMDIPETTKKQFYEIIDASLDTSKELLEYNILQSKNMSYFIETISAIRLASLITQSDKYILDDLLDMPKQYKEMVAKNRNKITLMLPAKQNYPLMDYFIDFKGNQKESESLKISVKAKLTSGLKEGQSASGDTNTVKFQDLFENTPANVDIWYDNLNQMTRGQLKEHQYGPKIIAHESVKASVMDKNVGGLYPIKAVAELLESAMTSKNLIMQIKNTLKKFGVSSSIDISVTKESGKDSYTEDEVTQSYVNAIKKIGPGIGKTYKKEKRLVDILSGKDLYIIEKSMGKIMKSSNIPENKVKIDVANLVVLSERILQQGSKISSTSKYNFYLMFFDNVLKKQHVIYSVATRIGPDKLKLNFYAMANWDKEYHKFQKDFSALWIQLRGKSATNSKPASTGALGISV